MSTDAVLWNKMHVLPNMQGILHIVWEKHASLVCTFEHRL